jgi:pSer/pThr/pTyr-binding forkhead associated (FHA) protein
MNTLRVRWSTGERSFEPGTIVRAGRNPDADIHLDNANVSRHHVEIAYSPTGWTLRDMGSAQGTWRDGRQLETVDVRGTVSVTLGREGRGEVLTLEASPIGAQRPGAASGYPLPDATDIVASPPGGGLAGSPGSGGGTVIVGDGGQQRPGGALRAEALDGATVVTGDALNVECGGRSYTFMPGQDISIGRDAGCDVPTTNPTVSRRHANLRHDGTQWLLIDNGSAGGTFVDGERITSYPLSGSVAAWLGDDTSGERLVAVARGTSPKRKSAGRPLSRSTMVVGAAIAVALIAAAGFILLRGGGSGPSNDELGQATVRIFGPDRSGSGTIIDAEQGLILTNAHVVAPSAPGSGVRDAVPAELLADNPREVEILVAPALGRAAEPRFVAEVVAVDGYVDLAVLRITKTLMGRLVEPGSVDLDGLVEVAIGDSAGIETGDEIRVFGYPGAAQSTNVTLVDGLVSGAVVNERMRSNEAMFNISAPISRGNSGGLAVNERGELIGVPTILREETVGSMRPSQFALPLIEAARSGEPYVSPYFRPLTDEEISNAGFVDPGPTSGIAFDCSAPAFSGSLGRSVGVAFDFEGFEPQAHQDLMVIVFANNSIAGVTTLDDDWPVAWPESGCATVTVPIDPDTDPAAALSYSIGLGPNYTGGGADGRGAEGTYVHEEEGTVVLESGGVGSITQSSDPVTFVWEREGDTITIRFDFDDSVAAVATLDGDELTFRAGDFSGDEPETFYRQNG